MGDEHVGKVTHYFAKPQVGVIRAEAAIRSGDVLRFEGHTTEFEQRVTSLEIDHAHVEEVSAGQEVALKVSERVRPGDDVYRLGGAQAGDE